MSSTEDRVKRIVCEQLGVGEEEVTTSASFIDDLGADSLDTVELVMAFEEEFEIEIPDEEAEKISTVQDAVDYIDSASFKSNSKAWPAILLSLNFSLMISTPMDDVAVPIGINSSFEKNSRMELPIPLEEPVTKTFFGDTLLWRCL